MGVPETAHIKMEIEELEMNGELVPDPARTIPGIPDENPGETMNRFMQNQNDQPESDAERLSDVHVPDDTPPQRFESVQLTEEFTEQKSMGKQPLIMTQTMQTGMQAGFHSGYGVAAPSWGSAIHDLKKRHLRTNFSRLQIHCFLLIIVVLSRRFLV